MPAEIAHLLEEIETKDRIASESNETISKYDTSLQKHVRAYTCRVTHPKKELYEKIIRGEFTKQEHLRNDTCSLMETLCDNVCLCRFFRTFAPPLSFPISIFFFHQHPLISGTLHVPSLSSILTLLLITIHTDVT